MVVSHVN